MKATIVRIATALVLGGAVSAVGLSTPAQAAGTTLEIGVSPLNQATASPCLTFPITFYVSVPDGAEDWSVSGDIITSAGASAGSVFEYEQAAVTQASSTYDVCVPEGTSTFTLAVEVKSYDWTFPYTGDRTMQVSRAFTVTRTTPPPPPPPVFVNIDGDVTRDKVARVAKLVFVSDPQRAGTFQGRLLVWKVRVDGKIVKRIQQSASDRDRFVEKFDRGTGRHKVVVYKNGSKNLSFSVATGS